MGSVNELDRVRREIGSRLREMRENRGMEQFDIANELNISQSKISRIESGRVAPTVEDMQLILRVLKAKKSERDELLDALAGLHTDLRSYRTLRRRGRRNVQSEISELEADTALIRDFQNANVTGLLQTAAYAQAIMSTRPVLHTPETVAEYVQARMARQQVLFDELKRFEFVMLESALRLRYSSPAVHAGQMHHVISMMSMENVSVHVVPVDAAVEVIPHTPFVMYDDRYVSVETITAQVTAQDPNDVAQYAEAFGCLKDASVTGAKAKKLIEAAAAKR